METLSCEQRKAKKKHKCDYCLLEIQEGEIYEMSRMKCNEYFYEWRSHLSCIEIGFKLEMFEGSDGEDGVDNEVFRETIDDKFQEIVGHDYDSSTRFKDRLVSVLDRHAVKHNFATNA